MILSCAPLQGFTEYPFRNALHTTIGGIDTFYAPYIRFENDHTIKKKYLKDIQPNHNLMVPLVPQILVKSSDDFLQLSQLIADLGYPEVNWNLGCPYPMVAKRQLGSGLLPYPDRIQHILETVIPKIEIKLSIKIRAGYESPDEIFRVIRQINEFPIHEIILHPRIGKQLYKGRADWNIFDEIRLLSKIPLAYNGDITDSETFKNLETRFHNTTHWMIGRGLLSNPFLGYEIKQEKKPDAKLKQTLFSEFHHHLQEHYLREHSGETHLIRKLLSYWDFFSEMFTDGHKLYKRLKKCHHFNEFNKTVAYILAEESWI